MTPRSQKRDLGHPVMVLDLWRFSHFGGEDRKLARSADCGELFLAGEEENPAANDGDNPQDRR
jgi:hypothetical protein